MENYLILNNLGYPVLSLAMSIPAVGALLCLFLKSDRALKIWGLVVTLIVAAISCPLFTGFDTTTAKYQFSELRQWFPALNLHYVVGVDGISVLLVLLTTFIMPLCILCSWRSVDNRVREFIVVTLLMETAMIGVFVSLNTVLFYIFWEGMLVPMYLFIAVWGGPRRDYASIKFFLYTFTGSIFLLVAIIALYIDHRHILHPGAHGPRLPVHVPAMDIPRLLPFLRGKGSHVPAAYLAARRPRRGADRGKRDTGEHPAENGRLRLPPFLPAHGACRHHRLHAVHDRHIAGLHIFGGYLALGQSDIKKLIAYSSVGHMGFVTLGIFLLSGRGITGAVLQMINHGISTGALFICVGIIYERTHSREIGDNSALGMMMPVYLTFLGIFSLASFGFPGTNNFVSEFLVLIAAFAGNPLVGAGATLGAVLAAAYMLRLLQKMAWAGSDGHVHNEDNEKESRHKLWDLSPRETATLGLLTLFVFWLGFYPKPFLSIMDSSVKHLVNQVEAGTGHNPSRSGL